MELLKDFQLLLPHPTNPEIDFENALENLRGMADVLERNTQVLFSGVPKELALKGVILRDGTEIVVHPDSLNIIKRLKGQTTRVTIHNGSIRFTVPSYITEGDGVVHPVLIDMIDVPLNPDSYNFRVSRPEFSEGLSLDKDSVLDEERNDVIRYLHDVAKQLMEAFSEEINEVPV